MCTVLVADDDSSVRNLVCAILGSAGHDCFSAANGLEALSIFRSNRDRIDLVITDVVMPVMDGPQAVLRIRETNPAARVIFITGYNDRFDLPPEARVLQKPFTPQALIDAVENVVPR